MRLLPSAPLLARFPGWTSQAIADELGVTRRTIERWKVGGQIRAEHADGLAAAAGCHQFVIWPELADEAVAGVEKACARCGRRFVPKRTAAQKYCRAACRVAASIEARPKVEPVERLCAWCGAPFTSIRSSHIRCSQACNRAARYAAKGDDERAYQREYNASRRTRERAEAA